MTPRHVDASGDLNAIPYNPENQPSIGVTRCFITKLIAFANPAFAQGGAADAALMRGDKRSLARLFRG
jgi:hypothetical protein